MVSGCKSGHCVPEAKGDNLARFIESKDRWLATSGMEIMTQDLTTKIL